MTNGMTPALELSALKTCYGDYIEKFRDQLTGITVQDILSGWVGGGKLKEEQGKLFEEYRPLVEVCVQDLCRSLEGIPADESDRWALEGLEIMLFYPVSDKDPMTMLIALEPLAQPLIFLLGQKALEELVTRYQKRNPKYRMLPNQSNLLKIMKKQLKK